MTDARPGHSDAEIAALLARPIHAVVGTNRRRGGPPQLSVVWFVWDGTSFRFSTTTGRAKHRNIEADPNISILIDDPVDKWYVTANGPVTIAPQTADFTRELFGKYMPDVADERAAAIAADRVIVSMTPTELRTGS